MVKWNIVSLTSIIAWRETCKNSLEAIKQFSLTGQANYWRDEDLVHSIYLSGSICS